MAAWKKKRDVMRRYDVTADMYDRRYAEEQTTKIEAALKHVVLGEKDPVLDIGCGTGLFFSQVADKTGFVVGLDVSKRSLLVAKKRAKTFGSVGLVLGDADHMPFRDRVFSHVFAFTLIQNVPCPSETLREFKRVAKSGAVFVVTGLKRIFTQKAFASLLGGAGLRVVAFEDGDHLKCYVAICATIRH